MLIMSQIETDGMSGRLFRISVTVSVEFYRPAIGFYSLRCI